MISTNRYLKDLPLHKNFKTRFYAFANEFVNEINVVRLHGLDLRQLFGDDGKSGVAALANEGLYRFGGISGDDPICGFREWQKSDDENLPGSVIHIRGGHHRLFEIARRVKNGIIEPQILIEFLIKKDE